MSRGRSTGAARRACSQVLMFIIATGGVVYTKPSYHHLIEAARAKREGWGKCKADMTKKVDTGQAAETAAFPSVVSARVRARYGPPAALLSPSALDRTLLRPPIVVARLLNIATSSS